MLLNNFILKVEDFFQILCPSQNVRSLIFIFKGCLPPILTHKNRFLSQNWHFFSHLYVYNFQVWISVRVWTKPARLSNLPRLIFISNGCGPKMTASENREYTTLSPMEHSHLFQWNPRDLSSKCISFKMMQSPPPLPVSTLLRFFKSFIDNLGLIKCE